jgi:hypothetical protein
VSFISNETRAWLRAVDAVGVELPLPVEEARWHLEKIEAEREALPARVMVPSPDALLAGGISMADALKEHAKLQTQAAKADELHELGRRGRVRAASRLTHIVGEYRPELILSLRPHMTALVEKASPLAAALTDFAPSYDAAAVARRGTPELLVKWQEADALERVFGKLCAAWRVSFNASSQLNRGGFDVRNIEESHHYWERPELVGNDRLNGTFHNRHGYRPSIEPTLLGVAAEPAEAGFRLVTNDECRVIYDEAHRARVEASPYKFGRRSVSV